MLIFSRVVADDFAPHLINAAGDQDVDFGLVSSETEYFERGLAEIRWGGDASHRCRCLNAMPEKAKPFSGGRPRFVPPGSK
jgi:hypothetical protein